MVRTDAYNAMSGIYSRSMEQAAGAKAKGPGTARKADNAKAPAKSSSAASGKTETPKLSKAASDMLDRLKEEHGDMDIMVANYSNIDEAKDIMKGSSKDVSVLFTADELEEMAKDPEKEKEMMANVDKAKSMSEDINNRFGDTLTENSLGDISRIGIEFKSDGSQSMFAELEKNSAQMQEKIDAAREKKAAEKKAAEEAAAEKAEAKKEEAAADEDGISITENARPNPEAGSKLPTGPAGPNPYEKPDTVKTLSFNADDQEALLEALSGANWTAAKESPVSGGNVSFEV